MNYFGAFLFALAMLMPVITLPEYFNPDYLPSKCGCGRDFEPICIVPEPYFDRFLNPCSYNCYVCYIAKHNKTVIPCTFIPTPSSSSRPQIAKL